MGKQRITPGGMIASVGYQEEARTQEKWQAMAQQHRKVVSILVCGREGAASSTRSPRLVGAGGAGAEEGRRWPLDLAD